MPELILMLTHKDRTVPDPMAAYEQVRGLPLGHVGFKDVGADPDELHALTRAIHADGRRAYLEIVAPTPDAEIAAIGTGVALGVDAIMGATEYDAALELLEGNNIDFLPFPGRVTGHPSRLEGDLAEIVTHARRLAARPGVTGLDLLAFRWIAGNGADLARAVCAAVDVPVVLAGSIDTTDRVQAVSAAGAWGFTVGGAAFEKRFVDGGLPEQVAALLKDSGRSRVPDGVRPDRAAQQAPGHVARGRA